MTTTIVDRKSGSKYAKLYKKSGSAVNFVTLGSGTARGDVLDYLGLETTEKTVIFSIQEEEDWLVQKMKCVTNCKSMPQVEALLLQYR